MTTDVEQGGANLEEETSRIPQGSETKTEPIAGPLVGVVWFFLLFFIFLFVYAFSDFDALFLFFGWRMAIALAGYLVMQIGLWHAENKWDEEGSAAYLEAAGQSGSSTPEELEATEMNATISDEKLQAAFPVPWGFLIGWWLWGISYMFPVDGTSDVDPTWAGIVALVVCFFVSFVASVPMSDAVMNRIPAKKMKLSLAFLLGWITLGIMSALDITIQINDRDEYDESTVGTWFLCMLGPITIILSQKILFGSRKMGTLWEESGKPNFHPIVYNMGGPLFVLGWFMLWMGTCSLPGVVNKDDIYYDPPNTNFYLPLFLNWRTWLSFMGGCAMVPVVRFLDFSHDEDGPWCNEGNGDVFGKWYLGTDGTYFGLFAESPWPFVMAWTCFGFSSFFAYNNSMEITWREILLFVNCLLQGVDAGILIQQNLYAGNMEGKQKFSMPFVLLFILLATNIGAGWGWHAAIMSFPGAILIILGQKTVFAARKRGDYTMQNDGKANPYESVFVYSWGEVFFMMGWIVICWAMSFPEL